MGSSYNHQSRQQPPRRSGAKKIDRGWGFRVGGLGVSGFGSGLGVQRSGSGFGLGVRGFGVRGSGFGFRVPGFGVEGLGFRV